MKKLSVLMGALLAGSLSINAATHYVGGDISLLPQFEEAGTIYKDNSGKPITQLLPWLKEQGMNSMRVRLFTDPEAYPNNDPNACQSLEYITPLCKEIVDCGFDLMLDFHYSDTWADPAHQWTPAAWSNLTDEQLYDKIYEYTRDVLVKLKEKGIVPKFIQPGNEISFGMLWGPNGTPEKDQKRTYMGSNANWERLGNLLRQAIKACREICPDAQIVIHTERVTQRDVQANFYNKMNELGVDYDIIGLSYYPYFHGNMGVLDKALSDLESKFAGKPIMIVEAGYPLKWEVPGSIYDNTATWPYTETGQNKFAQDLVNTLEAHPAVNGLYWWWMEYNAFNTQLSPWYNAPLFDSETGKATKALTTICSFAKDSGVISITDDSYENDVYYDINGRRLRKAPTQHGVYIHNGKKVIL